jgi:eukaryotic-like serine/threonine-protein kinase
VGEAIFKVGDLKVMAKPEVKMIYVSRANRGKMRRILSSRPPLEAEAQGCYLIEQSCSVGSDRMDPSLLAETTHHLYMGTIGLAISQTFSHYRLIEKLGEGGMGVVYLAEDTHLRRQVAVKFLSADRSGGVFHARFLREAQAVSRLNHPNIAAVYDYGETDEGRPFIVMELIEGKTLSDLLEAKSVSLELGIRIVKSLLEALGEAHLQGIIHRDIKPSNISISNRGVVKVLDFGLAKSFREESSLELGSRAFNDFSTQTLTGVVLGTPLYVSPEQATGSSVDPRSDIFSVGAVLYECLAGRPAFGAPSVVEIFARVISSTPPPPPSLYNYAVPPELDRIVLKSVARAIEVRYQSVNEFLEDLQQIHIATTRVSTKRNRVLGTSLDAWYRRIASSGSIARLGADKRVKAVEAGIVKNRFSAFVLTFVMVLVAALFVGMWLYRSEPTREPIDSIAVLPFINESHDENLEYLSDGLTESLIVGLSRLPGMKVISSNSVAAYKGREVEPATAGADLKVRAVLTGSVSRSGDELRVVVELVDARDGRVLWNVRRSAKASDLVSIRQEIVRNVSETLHLGLTPERVATAVRPPSTNPAAYELYMKGRWYWNKFTRDNSAQALDYFNQAVDIDPGFALAHVGIADTYVLMGWVPSSESYIRAKAAVEKALALDPELGEAHATLAFIKTHYERDWDGAEAEFRRSIELNPGYATAHHWYAAHLLARGQIENFYREIKLAQELDPLSATIDADVGQYFFFTRQYDRAIEHYRRNMTLFPNFFPTHLSMGEAYIQKGMYLEAAAEYEEAITLSKRNSLPVTMLGYIAARRGNDAGARATIRELEAMKEERNVPPTRFALIYTALGDKDAAFEWLNRAYDERDIQTVYVNVNPLFDSLRDDPRFAQFVQRLGLTPR